MNGSTQQVCMPIFHFSLLMLSLFATIIWGLYNLYNYGYGNGDITRGEPRQTTQVPTATTIIVPPRLTPDQMDDLASGEQPPMRRDYRKIYDPLKEPSRRYVNYPTGGYFAGNVNIPTQGYLPSYQLLGYMSESDKSSDKKNEWEEDKRHPVRMLKLYGRKIDSERYEYYTTNHDDDTIKIPLSNRDRRGDREIFDGDEITVPGYPGRYKVTLYNYESPRYIPSLY